MQLLENKVAVVTGGGRGIGAAIAKRLASLGARVAITGRTAQPIEATAAEIRQGGGVCEVFTCDVADLNSVDAMASAVHAKLGPPDILVNNAGVGSFSAKLHELDPMEWERVMNTNLRGVFYCMRAFTPSMIDQAKRTGTGGHIVNISSIASKNALPRGAVYAASKWGLNGLSVSAAEELREFGIRVSIVCPGSTETDLSPHAGKDPSKMLQPEDVAHAVEALVTQAPQSFISEIVLRPTRKP